MKWALRSIGSKQAVITNGVILHFGLLKKLSYKYIDGIRILMVYAVCVLQGCSHKLFVLAK